MCYKYTIKPEDVVTYYSLAQEAPCECCDLFGSKRWDPADRKEKSQYYPLLPKALIVAIKDSVNKASKTFILKSTAMGKTMTLVGGYLQGYM